jgi:hypothetical protein
MTVRGTERLASSGAVGPRWSRRRAATCSSPSLASVNGDGAEWPLVEQEVSCLFPTPRAPRLVGSAGSTGHFSWFLLFGPAKRRNSGAGRRPKARRRRATSRPPRASTGCPLWACPPTAPKGPIRIHTSGTNHSQSQGQDAGNRMFHRFRVSRPTRPPRTDALQGLIGFGRNLFRTAVGAGRDPVAATPVQAAPSLNSGLRRNDEQKAARPLGL